MDIILHWVQSNQGLAWVGSWILGITAVGALIHKYSPIVRKYLKVIAKLLEFIDKLLDALQDDKITDEEISDLTKEAQELKDAIILLKIPLDKMGK